MALLRQAPGFRGPAGSEIAGRHRQLGRVMLLACVVIGLGIEVLSSASLASPLALDLGPRRQLYRLGCGVGVLLALTNLAFAGAAAGLRHWTGPGRAVASLALRAASVLMPAGWMLGGSRFYGGDPGIVVLLVPVGGVLLLASVAFTTRAVFRLVR